MSRHETAIPEEPEVLAEIKRIKNLFVVRDGDSEDVPSYAKHVLFLREKLRQANEELQALRAENGDAP